MGSPGWADDARAELERVGARRSASAGGLTATERRVAELAVDGLANKEIARVLVVTVNTVEFHLRNTYAKLGIRSRVQLAAALDGLEERPPGASTPGVVLGSFLGSREPQILGSSVVSGDPSPGRTVEAWLSTSSSSTSHRATTTPRGSTPLARSSPLPS